jgi:hypothetical protein
MRRSTRRRDARRSRSPETRQFHYSIWGRKPGWGYESGWTFGETPERAVTNALKDASKYSRHKWKLPGNVYLHEAGPGWGEWRDSYAFYVTEDGEIIEGQGPGRDPRRRRDPRRSAVGRAGRRRLRHRRDPEREAYVSRSQNLAQWIDNVYYLLSSREASGLMRAIDDAEREGEDPRRAMIAYLREIGVTLHVTDRR